ncbi:hypothetical protein [Paenibacillus lactis]|uniref:DUF1574 domain-containing protein n=1 Tax=Paenibacillus lactis 154 TaxID=743719 RepID=G4HIR9_9BACL|nr:hypothetical protein [Paenibacillus lactis]EHB62637.1 hypothetical protein PaelaDRAFT_3880 [Paenibacillus lactis 154]
MPKFILNKTVFVMMISFALIGLLGLSIRANQAVEEMRQEVVTYAEKELRVPTYDAIVYTPLWVEYLKKHLDDGTRVIGMFGPSTLFGTTVRKGENTSAGVLQAHLKDSRVINLGISGGRFTETYALLASMIDKVDYVVFEINYGIVVVSDNEPNVVVYPSLVEKLGQPIPRSWLADFPDKNRESLPSNAHNWVTSRLLNQWTLYHDRDAISYRLFKTRTPMEKIRQEVQKNENERKGIEESYTPMYTAYDNMNDAQQEGIDQHYEELYRWNQPFDPDHSFGLFMIEQTLDLLEEHQKQAVFYSAPLDKEHIADKKLFHWSEYTEAMGAYQKLVESRGYPFIEFNQEAINTIPHEYYRDPAHLIDQGSHRFGEILYTRVKNYGIAAP